MGRYLENGYINFEYCMKQDKPNFLFMIGPRGPGKTWGAVKYMWEHYTNSVYMRLMVKQLKYQMSENLSDLIKIAHWLGKDVEFRREEEDIYAMYDITDSENEFCVCTLVSLYNMANVRGIGSPKIKYLFFDEFIPQVGQRVMRGSAHAFVSAFESINRNRELEGQEPLKCVFASNADTLSSDILLQFGLIEHIAEMQRKGKHYSHIPAKKISIYLFDDSPISRQKAGTALYQVGYEDYNKMALNNIFADDDMSNVVSVNLSEYNPKVIIDDWCIYQHKTDKHYYISNHIMGSPPRLSSKQDNISRRLVRYHVAYVNGRLMFETYTLKLRFNNIFTIASK